MSKLILVKDRFWWTGCDMCGYHKATKEYQKGDLKLDLCHRCVVKINNILKEDENFVKDLKLKFVNLINNHGPIIDTIHSNDAYYDVEEIINFCIKYFLIKKKENKNE